MVNNNDRDSRLHGNSRLNNSSLYIQPPIGLNARPKRQTGNGSLQKLHTVHKYNDSEDDHYGISDSFSSKTSMWNNLEAPDKPRRSKHSVHSEENLLTQSSLSSQFNNLNLNNGGQQQHQQYKPQQPYHQQYEQHQHRAMVYGNVSSNGSKYPHPGKAISSGQEGYGRRSHPDKNHHNMHAIKKKTPIIEQDTFAFHHKMYANHEKMMMPAFHAAFVEGVEKQWKSYQNRDELKLAIEMLGLCRHTLMYSYVFSYYLCNSDHARTLKTKLKEIEDATQKLKSTLNNPDTYDDIVPIRKLCQRQRKQLLNIVQGGYKEGTWTLKGSSTSRGI